MCACYAKHAASVLSVASRRAHQFDAGVRRGVLQRFDRTQSQQRSFRHLATNRSRGDPAANDNGHRGGWSRHGSDNAYGGSVDKCRGSIGWIEPDFRRKTPASGATGPTAQPAVPRRPRTRTSNRSDSTRHCHSPASTR